MESTKHGQRPVFYGSGWKGVKPEDSYIAGSMLISPLEQAKLVWKLETESLPFTKEHQRIVKNNLKVAGLPLWGKTGSGRKYPNGLTELIRRLKG
jgi:beta-lactamase class D